MKSFAKIVAVAVALAMCAAACSGDGSEGGESAAPETTAAPAMQVGEPKNTTTTIPEQLAFVDEGYTLRIGLPTLDFVAPHEVDETDPIQVLVTDLLTDGLTAIDTETGIAEPALAESWSLSDDDLTWTFRLGEHTFSDDSPVLASDVVASLERVAALGVESLSGVHLWAIDGWVAAGETDELGVAGLTAVDDRTIEMQLVTPFAGLPEVLAGVVFGVMPADERPQGSLPMGSSVEFVPAALWEDGLRVSRDEELGQVYEIELLIDPDGTLLEAGEVDMGLGLDADASTQTAVQVPRSAKIFFSMDATEAPFDDPMVRQAVLHAVDQDSLQAEFFPNMAPMDRLVEPGGASSPCDGACEADSAKALELAEAALAADVGFTVDFFDDGSASSTTEQALAERVVSQLRDVGLIATAQAHAPTDYGSRAANGELGLFRFGSISAVPSPEADLAAMFATDGPDNMSGTSIARVDEFIAAARGEANPEARRALYFDAERVLFAEAAIVPVATLQHTIHHGESLSSVGLEPDGSLNLSAITFATG